MHSTSNSPYYLFLLKTIRIRKECKHYVFTQERKPPNPLFRVSKKWLGLKERTYNMGYIFLYTQYQFMVCQTHTNTHSLWSRI